LNSTPAKSQTPGSGVSFLEVTEVQAGQRVDNFLLARLKGVPKSRIYRIIRKGEVRVNKKRVKPDYKICTGDLVRIPPVRIAEKQDMLPPAVALQTVLNEAILLDDPDLMVLNKPSGLPVHGGTGVKTALIESLRYMYPELEGLELVHRIDKGTSGCLLLSKNNRSLQQLTDQFRHGGVTKTYHALVNGHWPSHIREVNAALEKHQPRGGERFVSVSEQGKPAVTRFDVLKECAGATLIQAMPVTGRTHQIRVHTSLAGCPIIGDEKYASDEVLAKYATLGIKRLCLHAAQLSFTHPGNGRKVTLSAPYDRQFEDAISILAKAGD